jgi:hypothetical protein
MPGRKKAFHVNTNFFECFLNAGAMRKSPGNPEKDVYARRRGKRLHLWLLLMS